MAIDVNIPSQVKNYANLAAFPATGTLKTIFIAEDTNKTYRWTGSAYVEISAAGATGITIGTTAITSGTVGRVLFEGTGNVVQESANLFWDNTTKQLRLGATGSAGNIQLLRTSDGLEVGGIRADNSGTQVGGSGYTSNILFGNGGTMQFFASGEKMRLFSTGNLLINTTTDAGFKLDVNGTARVATSIVINGSASLLSSSLSIYQNSTNRVFSLATSTAKTSASERILFSLNSNDATNQQAMDFGYIGATLINDRYFYLQTSESSVGYGGGLVMQQNGGWASVGSATQVPSSVFHITSTTKGFLPPRMTTTQKNAIVTPAAGLVVYDTTLNKLCVYTTTWETITSL